MRFAHDTEPALAAVVALVNSGRNGDDTLTGPDSITEFVVEHGYTGRRDGDAPELEAVRALRTRLEGFWTIGRDEAAAEVNAILRECGAVPYGVRHGAADWHIHVTDFDDPLADRIGAEAAMAFIDLIRADEFDRLKLCAGPDCESVVIDMSRNRSRRSCAHRNCGNRANVAAYRERQAQVADR